jgi:hypothetical protein
MLLILYISSLIAVLLLCLIDVPKYKTNEKSFSKAWSQARIVLAKYAILSSNIGPL